MFFALYDTVIMLVYVKKIKDLKITKEQIITIEQKTTLWARK